MVGLQVAPTQPKEIDWRSSSGSAESFHRTVGVVRVAVRSGPGVYSMLINCSLRGVRPRVASSPGAARGPHSTGVERKCQRFVQTKHVEILFLSGPSRRPAGVYALNSLVSKEYREAR